ncbi:aldose epimerase family protein [Kordiimonas sp. SCSIO 12610]|uniref:aldose epimerase family protein n=1 Tax=Kordiimonas sp. SCSIO 12610 TaxID=2829597 RepID=UPI00210BD797|nr:aldose epimerase family protein [Kordiimonas sp. SCSIO 12610]UTW54339.1 galactose mutarotase [Kordiimonas sp. SCSIO 12610]
MTPSKTSTKSKLHTRLFGYIHSSNDPVYLYTFENSNGSSVSVTNLGAAITSINIPDHQGNCEDITLGFDTPQDYLDHTAYFGATIGRFANRIQNGRFSLNGKSYQLNQNENRHCLHGGHSGFDTKLWQANIIQGQDGNDLLALSLESPDGDEGFPGQLNIKTLFSFDGTDLKIKYLATTNKTTIINLTNHCYFNLKGHRYGLATDHNLMIKASDYTPLNSDYTPLGEIRSVFDSPFNFNQTKPIRQDINAEHPQINLANGYDHNWVLNGYEDETLKHAARLSCPETLRTLDIYTDQPCIQFYSGNFIPAAPAGKGNIQYQPRSGICLEAQGFPDSPNNPNFPQSILRPEDTYTKHITYRFGVLGKNYT